MKKFSLLLCFTLLLSYQGHVMAKDGELELMEEKDLEVLQEKEALPDSTVVDPSDAEEMDDLESLKSDIGNVVQDFEETEGNTVDLNETPEKEAVDAPGTEAPNAEAPPEENALELSPPDEVIEEQVEDVKEETPEQQPAEQPADSVENQKKSKKVEIFEVGDTEHELLKIASLLEGKISAQQWDELATTAKVDKYIVQDGDWLWKIAKNLFGSGFYYSKIWSLNPHITNPHEIEPGMVLVFDTGSSDAPPEVRLGEFSEMLEDRNTPTGKTIQGLFDFPQFGESTEPPWMKERQKLIEQGVFFQLSSEDSYADLAEASKAKLEREYEKYEPPTHDILIQEPGEAYDNIGFDKNSKITFDIKEGFFLNTFVTTNIVQDLGFVDAIKDESIWIQRFDHVYVKFDDSVRVKPGDKFSIYSADGKVSHPISDRSGHRYTINAQIKALRKKDHLWECIVTELTGLVERKDRITIYTPKINKIIKTFNKRSIEAAIINSYMATANGLSFGDVVYLDRGRADGVELGNVFEMYSFVDRGTEKRITPNPTYKIGEVTVITLTDKFATALITNSSNEMGLGSIGITKTEEEAARAAKLKNGLALKEMNNLEAKALDELDIELNLDDMSKNLLDQADKVQLTEDELEELERQEREKSVIKEHERDLRELERLEAEIVSAEKSLNEKKLDEDKFLEQQSLEEVEKGVAKPDKNAFESLDEIEQDIPPKYLDEDLNAKENPYGLTEYDLEEIDELLNTEPL